MPGTSRFFIACSVLALLIVTALVGVTWRSRDLPAGVAAGETVWRVNGCENCHTLLGEGGSFAPDLTHIYSQRGDSYLREFLLNPESFHPNQRVMPRLGLTRSETDDVLAFLKWIDEQNSAFPPRAINVSGGGNLAAAAPASAQSASSPPSGTPAEQGRYWFSHPPAMCSTCHSLEPNVVVVGPSLAGVASRAAARVPGEDAATYLRTSIVNPSAYIVPGFVDAMQKNFGTTLTGDQIDDLIAFLLTLQ